MTDKKIEINKKNITAKDKFNAISNAIHIFALKEEKTTFKLIEVVNNEDGCKAVAVNKDSGELFGIFTDSKSATSSLNDVMVCFGDDQPFITMHIKETAKGQSVYYVEVQ